MGVGEGPVTAGNQLQIRDVAKALPKLDNFVSKPSARATYGWAPR